MPDVILQTKLHVSSQRSALVPRPRLIEKLSVGTGGKLTLVSAAAGFGKTTIVSDWVHQLDLPVAWLSLDKGDDDPTRFWSYAFAALQGAQAELGENALAALSSPQPPPIETLLTNLINQATALSGKVILVFDDYHLIENQEVHQAIAFLLDHLPSVMHLVLISRSDPPLNLARLRGLGQLTEFREADLRFTAKETQAFFEQEGGELSSDSIVALHARTEGWIVGLQLASLAIEGREDAVEFIDAFAGDHSYLADYLTEEVFGRQPENVKTFLLVTSIPNRLNSPLCDAMLSVVGKDAGNSQRTLEYLDQQNLFLVPLDDRHHWYRYHQLFADMLRHRLELAHRDWVKKLHRQAGAWYAEHDFVREALHHLIVAEDWENSAELIESVAPDMIGQGRLAVLQAWIESLPERVIRKHPYLCLYHAWVLNVTNQVEKLEYRIQDAERALSTGEYDDYSVADIRGQIAAIRAYDARRRKDLHSANQYHHEALALIPEDNVRARSAALFHLGLTQMHQMNLVDAAAALSKARLLGEPGGNLYVTLAATGYLADVLVAQGQLHQAAEICSHTIEDSLARHQKKSLAALAYVYVSLGRILFEWNDLESAGALLADGVELGEGTGNWRATMAGMLALAWLRHVQGNAGEADALLLRSAELSDRARMSFREMDLAAWQTRFALKKSNMATTSHWAKQYQAEKRQKGTSHELSDRILVRVLIAQGQTSRALELLAQLSRAAEAADAGGWLIEFLALKALAHQIRNEAGSALSSLARALSLAEPEGYIRVFVDEGLPMAILLRQLAGRSERTLGVGFHYSHEYVDKLLAAFPQARTSASLAEVDALSERELQVLGLLAAGLKSPEIAAELHLANSTVKWYLRNIYGKLCVHRRADAIAEAHRLNLL